MDEEEIREIRLTGDSNMWMWVSIVLMKVKVMGRRETAIPVVIDYRKVKTVAHPDLLDLRIGGR